MTRRTLFIPAAALALAMSVAGAVYAGYGKDDPKAPKPEVTGAWTGTWQIDAPGHDGPAMTLDCKVIEKKGKWEATFEGECGRPYKYTITMKGRQAGPAVLFKGTADLGEKDGGVFDWIGRATDKSFTGFYTSKAYTGNFMLKRGGTTATPVR